MEPRFVPNCCDLLEEVRREGKVHFKYGVAVTMDILKHHTNEAKYLLAQKAAPCMEEWYTMASIELIAMMSQHLVQHQPQEPKPVLDGSQAGSATHGHKAQLELPVAAGAQKKQL